METKVVERIRKLMNLAGNNPSQEEAQSAMLKAQQLMAQHNIEMAMVKDSPKKEVAEEIVPGGMNTQWKRRLAHIICKNFRTELLLDPRTKGFIFLGLKQDTQISVSVFNYASEVLEKGMRKLRRDNRKSGNDTTGLSGDYASGFLKGLEDKFAEQVNKEGWGLILVKDSAVVEYFGKLRTVPTKGSGTKLNRAGNSEVYNKGYKAGQSIGVNKQIK